MLSYAITQRTLLASAEPERRAALLSQAAELARASRIQFLQLREKDLPPDELTALAKDIRAALEQGSSDPARRPKLLISISARIAVASRADGVHLTSTHSDPTPTAIRGLYDAANLDPPIISRSCHTLEEVRLALVHDSEDVPDLILFGPVFEKRVGEELVSAGSGLDLLAAACQVAAPIPVLALGGITAENIHTCISAGASGVAAIRLFLPRPW